jgi:hypothetical protein
MSAAQNYYNIIQMVHRMWAVSPKYHLIIGMSRLCHNDKPFTVKKT